MTQMYGAAYATQEGDAHEEGEEDSADSKRDQRNNVYGRAAGSNPHADCAKAVESNIAQGNYAIEEQYEQ